MPWVQGSGLPRILVNSAPASEEGKDSVPDEDGDGPVALRRRCEHLRQPALRAQRQISTSSLRQQPVLDSLTAQVQHRRDLPRRIAPPDDDDDPDQQHVI